MTEQRSINVPSKRSWQAHHWAALISLVLLLIGSGIFLMFAVTQEAPKPAPTDYKHRLVVRGSKQEDNARDHGRDNLEQIGIAILNHDRFQGEFPAATTFDSNGRALHGWQTNLLPFIEQQGLYRQIDLNKPWNHPNNQQWFRHHLTVYLHPVAPSLYDNEGYAITNYAANVHAMAGDQPRKLSDFTNGTSKVILVGEVAGNFKPWGYPLNVRDPKLGLNRTPDGFGGPWTKGTHFVMADGSVRVFSSDTDPEFLKLLAEPGRE